MAPDLVTGSHFLMVRCQGCGIGLHQALNH